MSIARNILNFRGKVFRKCKNDTLAIIGAMRENKVTIPFGGPLILIGNSGVRFLQEEYGFTSGFIFEKVKNL